MKLDKNEIMKRILDRPIFYPDLAGIVSLLKHGESIEINDFVDAIKTLIIRKKLVRMKDNIGDFYIRADKNDNV